MSGGSSPAGIGRRGEIPPAETPGMGHETVAGPEIDAFQHPRPAEEHPAPQRPGQSLVRLRGQPVQLPDNPVSVLGTDPPGRPVGRIRPERSHEQPGQLPARHNSFFFGVVTTKSLR